MTAARMEHPNPPHSLVDTIASVRLEFARMKGELRAARREIDRLKRSLSERASSGLELPDPDLASLRRHVAFYCHPDRSGDGELMRRLNVLFDFLQHSQDPMNQEDRCTPSRT